MVANIYIKCSVCSSTIRLRIQMGYRDIPFMFYCPDCQTIIKGEIVLESKSGHKKTWFENAIEYSTKANTAKYVQELSSEFLQKKISLDDKDIGMMLTPFMRNAMQGEEKIHKIMDVQRFYNFYSNYRNELETIQELYLNKKYDILKIKVRNKDWKLIERLKTTLPNEWEPLFDNQLDFLMVVHQSRNMLITNLLNLTNRQNVFDAPKMFTDNIIPIIEKMLPLIKYYGDADKFVHFNKRMNEITSDYMEILPVLLPVISSMDEYREELLSKEYIISYGPLYELTNLYQKMYELFCDGIDLVIGMNNAFNRGNYEKFCKSFSKVSGYRDTINSYSSKYLKYSELLMIFDKFSPPFLGVIHNKIRNAEGHFNRHVQPDTNEIVFKDLHKGNSTEIRIDYLEFATSVVDLFSALDLLFEYHYQSEKMYLQMYKGLHTNYSPHHK